MGTKLPKLPLLLERKFYKTGQTRGADDDMIYQNRVSRRSTVLIPYSMWHECKDPYGTGEPYEKGFIVLLTPEEYFEKLTDAQLIGMGLPLGQRSIVLYRTREEWSRYNPLDIRWSPASSRTPPLGGTFAARVPATTSLSRGARITYGYNTTSTKGAGIRVYEYASKHYIRDAKLQLESIFWHCHDAMDAIREAGLSRQDAARRRRATLADATARALLDMDRLYSGRALDKSVHAICPLCLEPLSARDFFLRMRQARGREVGNITVTNVNLFHVEELRPGRLSHVPYNLAWGHHHCNTVVRDAGVEPTVEWMRRVIRNNQSRDGNSEQ